MLPQPEANESTWNMLTPLVSSDDSTVNFNILFLIYTFYEVFVSDYCLWYQMTLRTIMHCILRNALKFQKYKSIFIHQIFFVFSTCKLLAHVKLVCISNYVMWGTSTMQGSSSNSWHITCNTGSITNDDCQHNTQHINTKM